MIDIRAKIRQYLGIVDSIKIYDCDKCFEKERFISYLQNEIQVLKKEIEIGSKKKTPTEQSIRRVSTWAERKTQLEEADRRIVKKRIEEKVS
jgi:hypothetical protein